MKNSFFRTFLAFLLLPLSTLGLLMVGVAAFFLTLPDVTQMSGCMTTSMNNVKLCPSEGSYVRYDQISVDVINAVVASEDATFFHHGGFDWHEMKESFSANLRQRGYKRGGSTITQQLAKNVFLAKEKSLLRKLREAVLTFEIERLYTKKEILERYLNVVEFGPNIYGIRGAARHYFQKAPGELHVLEAGFLAFLLPNPVSYSKSFSQGALTPFARKMVTVILRRLAGFRKISPDTLAGALARIDQFPWHSISQNDFAIPESIADSPTTSEVIEQFLNQEAPVDTDTIAPDEVEPSQEEEPEDEASDSSTWD
jgi:monofunctional glycosyltransferase